MATFFFFSFILLASFLPLSHQQRPITSYNTSAGPVHGKLNVHLVAHTHDDVGWLKTVDEYYVGLNNERQKACVQLILDTVISALEEDPNRKFIYVEQAFFQRWWRQQTEKKRNLVKKLVESGQLEFINGGWVMHDEATTHYIDMIDQTTFGHRFIKEQFGKTPRIGWQIDPFGHSSVQAYLLGAELGFDALFIARIDYQDKDKRKKEKSLEFVWQGSKSLGSSAQIFAGTFLDLYTPPPGFMFEPSDTITCMQDDPLLFDYNVKDRVDAFVAAALQQAQKYRTNHIMFTMGTDFMYQNAHSWYREMEKLIHHVNLDGRINTFYSTPSIYTDAKYTAAESWPLKLGDFFPYADEEYAYWTGYYTSRPALKGYIRMLSGYYLAARQLEFLVGKNSTGATTESLGDALATVQHHDGVSGTETQHVANDYALRLAIGAAQAAETVNQAFSYLTSLKSNSHVGATTRFEQCPLLNISYCPPSESYVSSGKTLVIVVYNSIGLARDDYVRIPVNAAWAFKVTDANGKETPSQISPLGTVTKGVRDFYVQAHLGVSPKDDNIAWLAFKVSTPPLGFNTYFVTISGKASGPAPQINEVQSQSGTVVVGPGNLKLTFSAESGQLMEMENSRTGIKIPIRQSYGWYASNIGSEQRQNSGAYIFRPNDTTAKPLSFSEKVHMSILRGPLLDEVHQQFSPWVYQVTRLYKDKEHVETEFTVGPIPVDDSYGKELVATISTNILNNGTFYTDSNGRDFIERVRNHRSDWDLVVNEPVAGNYYPLNLGIYIKDQATELSLLVDRALGGSSILDGQLELMLHRRMLEDDGRGLDEALSESVCIEENCQGLVVRGKYFTSIHHVKEGCRWRRSVGQQVYSPLQLAFTTQDAGESWQAYHRMTFEAMSPGFSLPENVALITLQELDDKSVLLRLAHLFEVGEDKELSAVVSVDLKSLFGDAKIVRATELSLSANAERSAMRKPLIWNIEGRNDGKQEEVRGVRGGPFDPAKLIVELAPMEIRTFSISLDRS